jgi:hypothetical protein
VCILYDNYFYPYGVDIDQLDYLGRQQPGGFIAPPPMGGGQSPTPMGQPPAFSPPVPAWQSGPSGIRGCLYRNTYIWLKNGNSFWFFPTFVGRNTIIGFQWRRIGWIYHIINPNSIRSYQCF